MRFLDRLGVAKSTFEAMDLDFEPEAVEEKAIFVYFFDASSTRS